MELVIDGFTSPRQKVQTEIPKGSPVSPILFLIYINGAFSIVEASLPKVTCVSFVDDLGFITSDRSLSKETRLLEKVGQIALEWGPDNAVTYDRVKRKQYCFLKPVVKSSQGY